MSNLKFKMFRENQQYEINKITTAVYNLGTIKGKGSSTRIYNNCLNTTNDNTSECMNLFIGANTPSPFDPNSNILFDISSFSDKFNLYRTGNSESVPPIGPANYYFKLPEIYITALTNAARRLNKLLKFSPSVNQILNSSLQNINPSRTWKGIQLFRAQIKNDESHPQSMDPLLSNLCLASTNVELLQTTTFPLRFALTINYETSIRSFNVNELSNILTHELIHTLGVPGFLSLKNGNGEELQPLLSYFPPLDASVYIGSISIDPFEPSKKMDIYPNAIKAYNSYGAFSYNLKILAGNNKMPLKHNGDVGSKNKHWENETLTYTDSSYRYIYSGFDNELMIGSFYRYRDQFISKITLNFLTDIYTILYNTKHFNYTVLNPNSEVTNKTIDPTTHIVSFQGSIPPYNSKGIFCLECNTKNVKNKKDLGIYELYCECGINYITIEEFANENPDV